ncbi:peptidase dimerization domain-containing protein [Brevibacterium linens]|uniref:Peptidase dimerisation domain-containing protein n=2 Tax=Brevibacterium TaxID=1696 RepID=A0A2H1J9V3_BRELN|nr:peptidase dimerization domain-containing protein [Brevibacterium linens]KAB1948099.1 amidohydrolase [Brevibacterium linens ATCC 9172]SMX84209.1 Peptidase dimerisation domain-containing protein [Brevibacterium linens ATCC 9172]
MRNVRVVTVGASNAGPKSNITPDRAELLLNVRTYDTAVRKRVIASIERIVRGEYEAGGTPKEPTFEYFDQFPLTVTSEAVNDTITEAPTEFFGTEAVQEATPATASDRGLSYEIFPCGSGIRSRS